MQLLLCQELWENNVHRYPWRGFIWSIGFDSWFDKEDLVVHGIPFRVKLSGLNTISQSCPDIESFRIPIAKQVDAFYLLGSGITDVEYPLREKPHPEGRVNDPSLFNIELVVYWC